MSRVQFRGFTLDAVTRDQVLEAERLAGWEFPIVQGSYNSGVGASAGSHDEGGAIDFSVRGLDDDKIEQMVVCTRTVGLWTWQRLPDEGPWSEHVHGITLGCPNLAEPVAANQEKAAYDGYNGLGHLGRGGPDPHAYLGIEPITWQQYLAGQAPPTHPIDPEDFMLIDNSVGGSHQSWWLLSGGHLVPLTNDEAKTFTGASRLKVYTTKTWRLMTEAYPPK